MEEESHSHPGAALQVPTPVKVGQVETPHLTVLPFHWQPAWESHVIAVEYWQGMSTQEDQEEDQVHFVSALQGFCVECVAQWLSEQVLLVGDHLHEARLEHEDSKVTVLQGASWHLLPIQLQAGPISWQRSAVGRAEQLVIQVEGPLDQEHQGTAVQAVESPDWSQLLVRQVVEVELELFQ